MTTFKCLSYLVLAIAMPLRAAMQPTLLL